MEHLQQTTLKRWPAVFIAMGALLAALSVIASAYAAHANSLNGSSPLMVQASLNLMQFHSIGQSRQNEKRLQFAGAFFLLGCLLFSINILLRAWHDIQTFRALVPWGGTSFILGWLAFALAYVRKSSKPTPSNAPELKPPPASE
jgi:uncharacterized membrane protein YgdD (TMEM256/DUF423 family)